MSDRSEILEVFAAFDDVVERLGAGYRYTKPVNLTPRVAQPAGSCSTCRRYDARPGRKCCALCVARASAWNAGPGLARHRASVSSWKARMRTAARVLLVCTMCLRRDARPERSNCVECAARQAERYAARTA